jgi:hypothetical protein
MSYRIVVTAKARADAIEAFRWIVIRSEEASMATYENATVCDCSSIVCQNTKVEIDQDAT